MGRYIARRLLIAIPTLLRAAEAIDHANRGAELFNIAALARFIRAEMLEHLPLEYVRTARSKGVAERFVIVPHVLRNSLIPVVTLVALGIPAVFAGAIVTEQILRGRASASC